VIEYHKEPAVTLWHGDSLALLRSLPDASVDAVVTDPPYSSGGMHRSDRAQATSKKYTLTDTAKSYPEFYGDNRDQRSFLLWSTLWMAECYRVTKPGGVLLSFVDWRQLPTLSDAIQCGGWTWRGIIPWDKTEAARPQKGWFRSQCEYVLSASHGTLGKEQERGGGCKAGLYRGSVVGSEKEHSTAKPIELMQWLLGVVPAGGTVLDPFCGSGTTLLAAKNLGYKSIGCEMSAEYCEIATRRLEQGVLGV
jgi:site-specific DNA-methyltransferase (adenine-specific)